VPEILTPGVADEFVAPPVAGYQQRPFLACPGGQKWPGGTGP
jgi:hypothetical protein